MCNNPLLNNKIRFLFSCFAFLLAVQNVAAQRDTVLAEISPLTAAVDIRLRCVGPEWSLALGDVAICVHTPDNYDVDNVYPYESTFTYVKDDKKIGTERILHKSRPCSLHVLIDSHKALMHGGDGKLLKIPMADLLKSSKGEIRLTLPKNTDIVYVRTQVIPKQTLGVCRIPLDSIEEYLAHSHDPIEGLWEYQDSDIDPDIVHLSGPCKYYVMRNAVSGYDIVYVSGMNFYKQMWHPGDIRGHLEPTVFADQFDLIWVDGTRYRLSDFEDYAVNDSNKLLTLYFPLLDAQVRLRKTLRH